MHQKCILFGDKNKISINSLKVASKKDAGLHDQLLLFLPSLRGREFSFLISSLKAESHCSDNEKDNDHDAKRTHSIG